MKPLRYLGPAVSGLLALSVTVFGLFFWVQSLTLMAVPAMLWALFLVSLVHALKPE